MVMVMKVMLVMIRMVSTDDLFQSPRRIRKRQMTAIFELMKNQEQKFGATSETDVAEQMKLYST